MNNILYLVHRLPYPPNKGDKVRSFNILKHLAVDNNVYLGSFVDDSGDAKFIDRCAKYCRSTKIIFIDKWTSRVRAFLSIFGNDSVSVSFYRSRELQVWVNHLLKTERIDAIVVFSGVMAQFIPWDAVKDRSVVLVDFVDVDSMKWADYASKRSFVSSWFYEWESRKLLAFEKSVSENADCSFFVTDREVKLFQQSVPGSDSRVVAVENGVDVGYFRPVFARMPVFSELPGKTIVFTGAMDYWPNVDAVAWFVSEIFPLVIRLVPDVKFVSVGRNPVRSVLLLAGASVSVTGEVTDVRPYLQFADVIVAPLRVARGVQNKVLEAMAMAQAVVASSTCAEALHPSAQAALSMTHDAHDFAMNVVRLLQDPGAARALGKLARRAVLEHYSWHANLSKLDQFLPATRKVFNEAPA